MSAYSGTFDGLRGVSSSQAYESTLRLSFDVHGGLPGSVTASLGAVAA
jgi:hypothetical protein